MADEPKALVPVVRIETQVEVVCMRREGAYVRVPEWSTEMLMLMVEAQYPVAKMNQRGVSVSRPAAGVTYRAEATLPPKPVSLRDFGLDFRGEVGGFAPKPLPPPGGVPGPGEELPFMSEKGMRRLIQSAVREKLSNESLDALAYLVRRAHGLGSLAGKSRHDSHESK